MEILLPRISAPSWFVNKLEIPLDGELIVLDDQPMNHAVLRQVLKQHGATDGRPVIHSFFNAHDLRQWQQQATKETFRPTRLYLCDFDLGRGRPDGLQVITELGIASSSVLITGHGDRVDIQARCAVENVRLICRDDLPNTPIFISAKKVVH